ncbi:hypothetical protein CCZ01_00595 [Helicobacter monodelphidis]|uniref:YceI family protein n=1 Tax=Helicobacter sp. 15-1451 TaxID=2004995 RepID=UPI000DCD3DC2|nr:YceI family protein [Helicobacter sp. 15-1451]RAX59270.1 hypothetical protein CCZ01_00595 [Helicobacter sp. 15-1451]
MLRKSLLALVALGTLTWGANLDTTKTKMTWTAYKFYDKTPVSGTFGDIKYDFGKVPTSIEGLKGAKATINGLSVDLADETKNQTVKENFFQQFKSPEIVVVIDKITADAKNKNKGRLEATITMNGKSIPAWLPYEVKKDKFYAQGVVDFNDFALNSALAKLHESCKELHEGKTWSEATISVEIPIKK